MGEALTPYYHDEASGLTLHLGTHEAVLPTLPAGGFDLIFTSPPYNLGNTTGAGMKGLGHYRATDGIRQRGGLRAWRNPALAAGYDGDDDSLPHEAYVAGQHAFLRACWPLLSVTGAIFYNHKPRILGGRLVVPLDYVPGELRDQVRQEIIWARAGGINHTGAFYTPTHERIVVIARDAFRLTGKAASAMGDVWYVPQETKNPHPAPFPLGLPLRAIETTGAASILDPYCGSATTLLAAKHCGRRAVGIERSARYCALAVARLQRQSVMPLALAGAS